MLRRLLTSSPRTPNPNASRPKTQITSSASSTDSTRRPPSPLPPDPSTIDDEALRGTDLLGLVAPKSRRAPCSLADAGLLQSWMLKMGSCEGNLFFCNTLVNVYAKAGELGLAQEVFDSMTLRNSVTWACLISGFVSNGAPEEACSVFRDMVREGWGPSRYVYGSVIKACNEKGSDGLAFGRQVHGMVVKTLCSGDSVISNALISMYGRSSGLADDALCVFDEIRFRNSISWNSIISVFLQRGDVASAFRSFSCMQKEGGGQFRLEPNEYTFGSLITVAGSSTDNSEKLLEQMLARVKKSGFIDNLYVGSALVSALARFGLADYAKDIFWQLSIRNVVSMNGLMVGLVRQKAGEEALQIFMETRGSVDVSVDSYLILLSSFAEFTDPEEGKRKGREVHAYLVRNDLMNRGVSVGNALVNMYAKCGAICNATLVFRSMTEKDLISWNSLITGLDQNDCFEDAVMSFQQMRRSGLMPANYTLISALSSCASLRWNFLGYQIHAEGIKLGLDLDCSVSNALLAQYSETGHISNCQKLFSLMLEHDQISWNSIIGAFAHSEESVCDVLNYFSSMLRAGWRPSMVTFISLFASVSSFSDAALNRQVHALVVKYNLAHDCAIENALLTCYGKCGEMDECEKIFSRMTGRRDDVSWNALISGYIHNEFLSKAMDMVWSMLQRGQRLDSFTFATILSACASVATLERGMEVHACGIRANLESDVVVGSALIDMYSKCGRVDYASRFFNGMPQRNVYSWNSMISGFARHGLGDEALKLFARMKLSGQQLDHVTFVGVLSACSHVGLVKEGFDHFESMQKEYGLAPKTEHYSCMVDLLGRAGELAKMENFIDKMPIGPNVLIWRTVLAACCRANGRNSKLGQRAANMLLEMEPRNAVNYVLLSNMYASGGNWVDMGKARTAMNRVAVKKEAGCSWVTMKDGVHVFVAGDRSHPNKDQIYSKLRELNQKIRDAGYVPLTGFSLYDLDAESKEELLSYHSEKIAVAFVLTRKSEMPIRIMKNLRVCGDCHSAFKYISKIVNRTIVLRDSNRFHHFEEGACSCRDYW